MPSGIYKRIMNPWNKGTKGICKPNSGSFKSKGISREGYISGVYIKKYPNGYKTSEETKEKLRQINLGKKYSIEVNIKKGRKGIKFSEEHKNKISESKIKRRNQLGYVNSTETRIKIGLAQIGHKVSFETRKKHSDALRGNKNPHWEGGRTKLNLAIRRSYKYRQWREEVFKQNNHTCQTCFVRGGYLEADHIKAFCLILKENNIKTIEQALDCQKLWDVGNGRTLCKSCHKKTENHAGRAKLLLRN